MKRNLTIDLFCGAGGLSQGFRSEGFNAVFANDTEIPALDTYRANHEGVECSSAPIEELDAALLRKSQGLVKGELAALIGGPPCQGFSTYGQRNLDDTRNQLYNHYIRFLDEYRPTTFLIENVVGILSMDDGRIVEDILTKTRALGYNVDVNVLDAVAFGVPQYRKRVFFLGSDKRLPQIKFPIETHTGVPHTAELTLFDPMDGLQAFVTVRDAISDLPSKALPPKATNDVGKYESKPLTTYQREMRNGAKQLLHHAAKQMLGIRKLRLALMRPGDYGTQVRMRLLQDGLSQEIIDDLLGGDGLRDIEKCRQEDRKKDQEFRAILTNGHVDIDRVLESIDSGGFANKYRRLIWDEPSHTLVAHMARDCSDFVHPDIDRFISVREAARLQSFPDNYTFVGSQFRQFKQIGNAVPPRLGAAIARQIRTYLEAHQAKPFKNRTKASSPVPMSPK